MNKISEGRGAFKFLIRGAGSILKIFGKCIPVINTGAMQDTIAIRNDWYRVGNDIKNVMNNGRQ